MNTTDFYKITLPFEKNLFHELRNTTDFENSANGRIGNHLVKSNNNNVPIVRTTTKYHIPPNLFLPIHQLIIDEINNTIKTNKLANIPTLRFNNALIEVYNQAYKKMKYHSDQALDLNADSYIALFTCYENPNDLTEQSIRKLKIKNKLTLNEFEFALTHNSVILFSVSTNANFLHKIVLDANQKTVETDNKWLGITFRQSKTFIHFKNNLPQKIDKQPLFSNGKPLTIATENEKTEFYKLRGQENRNTNFNYPELTYTLSLADTLVPKQT